MLQYFYYDVLKTRKGPFSLQELRTLKAAGAIDDSTRVMVDGGNKEIPLRDLENLQNAQDSSPAPSPPKSSTASNPPANSSRPTAVPPSTGSQFKIPIALIGIPLVLLVIGVLIIGGGLLFWFGTAPKYSAADDEIQSSSKRSLDFAEWRDQITTLTHGGQLVDGKPVQTIGWWAKRSELPPDAAAKAVLSRRLPSDVALTRIELQSFDTNADGTRLTYVVTVKPKQSLFLVSTVPIKFTDPAFKNYQNLAKYVIAAPDLPSGLAYVDAGKKILGERNADFTFDWTIRRAVKTDGTWKILDSAPTPFEINPKLEQQLRAQGGAGAIMVRPESVLAQAAQQQSEIYNNLLQRVQEIDAAVATYRTQANAGVPGQAVKDNTKFGGSGSGEPTKTGVRVLGGAAGGAAIGGLAGGGEGAGWGALGGAVVGGVYDGVSKSNDKKRFEAEKQARYDAQANARASAQRQAANAVAAYQKSLVAELETQLKTAADAHNSSLGIDPTLTPLQPSKNNPKG